MNPILKEISNQIFGEVCFPLIEKRLEILYEDAVLFSDNTDVLCVIVSEILGYEKENKEFTIALAQSGITDYTDDLLINELSQLSLHIAINAVDNKNRNSVLAVFLDKLLCDFLKSKENDYEMYSMRKKRLISDTILDFGYASGRSDVMSMRLHDILG